MLKFQLNRLRMHYILRRSYSSKQDTDNKTALYYGASLIVAMIGASYLAVPIYQMICTQTGLDGTPKTAAGNINNYNYRP